MSTFMPIFLLYTMPMLFNVWNTSLAQLQCQSSHQYFCSIPDCVTLSIAVKLWLYKIKSMIVFVGMLCMLCMSKTNEGFWFVERETFSQVLWKSLFTVIFWELAIMSPMREHHFEFSENNSIIIVAFLASRANAL